jgi:ribosomal protein S18 acetylase RimI-like enzyme
MALCPLAMDVVCIEYLRASQVEEVHALEERAYSFVLPDSMRTATRLRKREGGVRLVAVSSEHVVGYVTGSWFWEPPVSRDARSLYIVALAVDEQHRRKGIARRLMGALFERAGARGARNYQLHVEVENRGAIALYESLGFKVLQQFANCYGPGQQGLSMVRSAC